MITRRDLAPRDLRKAAGRVKDGRVARRILAIALVLEGVDRKTAAQSCGMDRQTLRDWAHRYNAEGLENRGGGGRKPRLSPVQMAQLATWVEVGPDPKTDGVVRWRCIDLKRRIEAAFGVELHERTVGKLLAALAYRRLSVRPQHPKADPGAQAAFKKLPRSRSCRAARSGAGQAAGDLVSRRGKGRAAGHADPGLGQARHPAPRHPLPVEPYFRCRLRRPRHHCRPRLALRQHRGHDPAPGRDCQGRSARRARGLGPGRGRMARQRRPGRARQHHAPGVAALRARAEPGRKHLAVSSRQQARYHRLR
jgi:transposase